MNQITNTIVIAVTAAIVTGAVTFMVTHPPRSGDAQAAETVVQTPPPSVPAATPQAEPVRPTKSVTERAAEQGIYLVPNYGGDRDDMLQKVMHGRDAAKRSVLNLLNDPESAQFRYVGFSEFENGAPVYCGTVNARNVYGGYAPFRPFYAVGSFASIDDGSESWSVSFRRVCDNSLIIGDVENF